MLARTADGAMLADERGNVIVWNKTAERLLGFRAAEVIGRPCNEVMRAETLSGHPFCSPECVVGHRLGCGCGGGARNFDIQTPAKGGKTIWLNVGSLPEAEFLIGGQPHLGEDVQNVFFERDKFPIALDE